MAFETATRALGDLMFGQRGQKARRRPAFLVGLGGERGPDLFEGGQRRNSARSNSMACGRHRPDLLAPPNPTVLSSS